MSSNGSTDQSVPRGEAGDVTLERDGTEFQQAKPAMSPSNAMEQSSNNKHIYSYRVHTPVIHNRDYTSVLLSYLSTIRRGNRSDIGTAICALAGVSLGVPRISHRKAERVQRIVLRHLHAF